MEAGVELGSEVGSVAGRQVALTTQAHILMLLSLDDLWTGTVDALRAEDITLTTSIDQDLRRLVDALREGLLVLDGYGRDVYGQLDQTTPEQFAEAAQRVAGDDEAFALLLQEGLPDFELRGAVLTAWQYVLEELATERELLADRLWRITSGQSLEGDFRLSFRCAAALAGVGATVAAAVVSTAGLAVIGLTAAGGASTCAAAWTELGCPRLLPEISRYRR